MQHQGQKLSLNGQYHAEPHGGTQTRVLMGTVPGAVEGADWIPIV